MRGRKGAVDSPSGVISTAIYMGLVALVRLSRNRTSRKFRQYFSSIEKMWNDARESYENLGDFLHIQNAEPNMRKAFLQFVWMTAKRFGNKEFKRVYNWMEGSVGTLNALLNYAGARLRELAMICYPFPKPQTFQIRKYPDGSRKILTRNEAKQWRDDDTIDVYWRYGYERERRNPRILIAHPTLPGMDFVDMLRTHCVELCRQCFIYKVPRTEAHRYIRLLIHRLKPFLDWVYTDGRTGRANFNPHSDHELRRIVLEIRALYTKQGTNRIRISEKSKEYELSLSIDSIRERVINEIQNVNDSVRKDAILEFLDYLDTAQMSEEDMDQALIHIKGNLESRLQQNVSESERVAVENIHHLFERKDKTISLAELREEIVEKIAYTSGPTEQQHYLGLLELLSLNSGYIVNRDVEKFAGQVLSLSGREGNYWHQILLSDFHHPTSLKQVVYAGDKMLETPSPILIVAELPIANRSGQIDLSIFIRREIDENILWTPIMLLEVKTKTSLEFNLYGMQIKQKTKNSVTPAFYVWKRDMNETEWTRIIGSEPDDTAIQQLKDYENELLSEYRQITTHDTNPPVSLWKGVIVLDTNQSPRETFAAFQYLLDKLTTDFIFQIGNQTNPISITPEPKEQVANSPRVGLLLSTHNGPSHLLKKIIAPDNLSEEDPFCEREQDDRLLTLYVSVSSPTSSGTTAARISKNWHLLHHIQECIDNSQNQIDEVYWLDLLGNYKSDELVRKRFGIETLLQEKKISRTDYQQLTRTIHSIRFLDLSPNVDELMESWSDGVKSLCELISSVVPECERERIVVLDGWSDFKEMVSGHHQNLLNNLESQLLDVLPQSNINLIWIDNGSSHTRMNSYYQRSCIKPLRHDSPRRTHLDEIIYNLPTRPSGFGWMAPQSEDVRIIVQDTPTQVEPWRVAIRVPQLQGFAQKFRGLARRDRLVSHDEVVAYTDAAHMMHKRAVNLSNIYAPTGHLSTQSFLDVIQDALTLIPSVLRTRDSQPDTNEPTEELTSPEESWDILVQKVDSKGTSTLSSRITPNITRPPPVPRRGEHRYINVLNDRQNNLTRPWFYELAPKQVSKDDDGSPVFIHPPQLVTTEPDVIDTIVTRELEVRRLNLASKFLGTQEHLSMSIIECCNRIEQYCKKQLDVVQKDPSLKTMEFFHQTLTRIRRFIVEVPTGSEIWNILVPIRQDLPNLLNLDNRQSIVDVMDRTEDVFLLYGNNLFLAVLAALDGTDTSLAEHLWNSIAEWVFYQIGMRTQDDSCQSVYSLQSIYSNLKSRIKTLTKLDLPKRTTIQQDVGAIYWRETRFGYDALLIISHEADYITALIENVGDKWIPAKWHKCVTDSNQLKTMAKDALKTMEKMPIVVTTTKESKIFWIQVEDEYNEQQWLSFSLTYGKPDGRWKVVPWLQLQHISSLMTPDETPLVPIAIEEFLSKLARIKQKPIQVTLSVIMNEGLKVFEVLFNGSPFDIRLEFSRTRELVQFLRLPIRQGTEYRTRGFKLIWDHKEDINYADGLAFLKPLIHRSRFFPDVYHYPKTAKETILAERVEGITMTVHPSGIHYKLQSEEIPRNSVLKELEEAELDVYSLGLLAECGELYDPVKKRFYPFNLNVDAIMDLQFSRLGDYPTLHEAIQTADIKDFRWEREAWKLWTRFAGNEIRWSIVSVATERPWRGAVMAHVLTPGKSPDKELKMFRQEIQAMIPLSFLDNLDDRLDSIRQTLIERFEEYHTQLEDTDELDDKAITPLSETTFRFEGVEISDQAVIVSLSTEDGDLVGVSVLRDVKKLVAASQLPGGIEEEYVDTEVDNALGSYQLEEDMFDEIRDEVKRVLIESGVRFYDD